MTSSRGHPPGSRPDNNSPRAGDRREPLRPVDLVVIDVECNVLREELTGDAGPVPQATSISSVGSRGAVHRQRADVDVPAFVPRVVGVHAGRPVGPDEPELPALAEVPLRGRNVMLGVTAGVLAFALGAMAVGITQQRSQQEIPSVSQRAATQPTPTTRGSSVIATSTTGATVAAPSASAPTPPTLSSPSDAAKWQSPDARTDVTTPVEPRAVQDTPPPPATVVNADASVQASPSSNPPSTGARVAPTMAPTTSSDTARTAAEASPATTADPTVKATAAATPATTPTIAAVKPVVVTPDAKPRAPVAAVGKSVSTSGSAQASARQAAASGETSSSAERVKAALARLERRGPDPRAGSR
jgi:hypothetical protein